jgi:hypothetical protein
MSGFLGGLCADSGKMSVSRYKKKNLAREDSLDRAINGYTDSEHDRLSQIMPIQQRTQSNIAIGATSITLAFVIGIMVIMNNTGRTKVNNGLAIKNTHTCCVYGS